MDYTRISVRSAPPVVTVTLNRPEVHNAFDETLVVELTECFARLGGNPAVRVIALAGAGVSFCAGADLTWMERMAGYTHAENVADARAMQRMFAAIAQCPKVTVARVHGAAVGGGAGLVAACDVAIAAEEAKLAFSEVRLGLAPAVIAPYVVAKVGIGAARALFLTGEWFAAAEALRMGLVQQVAATADLDKAVDAKIAALLNAGPEAVAAVKRLLGALSGPASEEAADASVECLARLRVSPEGQEGIRAFLQKRKPGFAG